MSLTPNFRNIFVLIYILIASMSYFQLKVIDALSVTPPNFIIVLTDDQDVVLNGMTPMQRTLKLLGGKGASFINAFTSSPICCPSRASILSGQYAHNHHTTNNSISGGCYGDKWKHEIEPRTFPVFFKETGYNTFYAGKYLNEYRSTEVPPGYTEFYGLHGNSKYYNYTLNENGVLKHFGDQEQEYLTDVLRNRLEKFIGTQVREQPFLAVVAPPAAHEPFTPAKRHVSFFGNVTALRTPNFNIESKELDKHWIVRMPPVPITVENILTIDEYYRGRWQSLLAVDELIENMVIQLQRMGLYENTYIIFTSDNGYHLGQFAMPFDKRQPYETDIRVPFLVTGPGIQSKHIVEHPITLIDLMPTIFDWAGIKKPEGLDGQSFSSLVNTYSNSIDDNEVTTTENTEYDTANIAKSDEFERHFLIEYWGEGNFETSNPECPWHARDRLSFCSTAFGCHCNDAWNNTYGCVRHIARDLDKIYCEFNDREAFVEAYDLFTDPFQMNNLGFDMLPSERAAYSRYLYKLKTCEGQSCQTL